jgi:hypothetical protein
MGNGIGDKREDFLSNLRACHGTAPVLSSGPIESPQQPWVEVTRAQVSLSRHSFGLGHRTPKPLRQTNAVKLPSHSQGIFS